MKKINVCHVMSALEAGGVEAVVYNYCSKMNLDKYNMHILHQRTASRKNKEEFTKLGFSIQEIPEKTKNPIKNYYATKKYLQENSIDVVHAHMTLVNFIPLMAAKHLGINVRISHSHNSDVRKKSMLRKIAEMIMKKITLHYSTVNLACGEEAGKYLYGKHKFQILNNALDLKKYSYNKKNKKELASKLKISEKDIIIGNIGRFTNQKNQAFLLDVFNEVLRENDNYKLVIVGDGELKDELINKTKELNIYDKVIFTGNIDNANEYYSLMDCFLFPSNFEGLPYTLIEAQANGLPIIASNKISEEVNISNSIIFYSIENDKIDEWASLSIKLAKNKTNKNYENKIIENGYSISNTVDELLKIYEKRGK